MQAACNNLGARMAAIEFLLARLNIGIGVFWEAIAFSVMAWKRGNEVRELSPSKYRCITIEWLE
jgi:hypothetical protein